MTGKRGSPESNRLLLRSGRYNVVRRGFHEPRFRDLYYRLLGSSWVWLMTVLVVSYVVVNILFALTYLAIGDGLENARPGSFEDAFFFSVQTMATISFGKFLPRGLLANTLVTAEALMGLGGIAVATGLVFAKFSRPTARVIFSRNAVVALRDGVPRLMLRVANERDSMIVEAQMRLVLVRTETTREGETMRRFHDLELERASTAIFALSWTVSHRLDDKSPLHGLSAETLAEADLELVCSLTGTEEMFASTVHARFSYSAREILMGYRFADILSVEPDGRRSVDYTRFHDVVVDEPRGGRATSPQGRHPAGGG